MNVRGRVTAAAQPKPLWARTLRVLGLGLFWAISVLGVVMLGTASWIRRTFGPITIDQMLMNLDGGGTAADGSYVTSFLWQAVVIPVVLLGILVCVLALLQHRVTQSRKTYVRSPRVATDARRPVWKTVLRPIAAVAVFAVGATGLVQAVKAEQFVRSVTVAATMSDYYVEPSMSGASEPVGFNEGDQKNLVLIFLESGEETFSDESLFGQNLNAPLEDATVGWDGFDRLDMYAGSGWTMAGIVGTECGVPLRGPGLNLGGDPNEIGADGDGYMTGAVCLGDVLADAGYRNVFLGGANAAFASKSDFLFSHGYDTVKDYDYWVDELGETELSPWGLSDGRLLERAKEEVTALHDAGQPFNLTMLTLDVHEPIFVHDYCSADTEDPTELMSAITLCSMEQVAGFVDYMNKMGYLEDTVVMITGDHQRTIGEGRPFYDELGATTDRPLFNRFWSPDGQKIERTQADQLSLFATLLDALGLGRSDGRAGVGVSALMHTDDDASAVALDPQDYDDVIMSRSADLYERLWATVSHPILEAGK